MSNYAVVRTDNLAGITDGSKLVSFKYYVSTTPTAVENGNIVSLDSFVAGSRDVWKAVTPTSNQAIGKLVLVANPELNYESNKRNLTDYTNAAGSVVRGYVLCKGDIFAATAAAFDATPDTTTNKYVLAQADTKIKVSSSDSNAIGEIIAVESEGGYTYYVVRVL